MDSFTMCVFATICATSVSASDKTTCVIGYLNSCLEHQKCVGITVGGRHGYCDCIEGYIDLEEGLGRQVSVFGFYMYQNWTRQTYTGYVESKIRLK